MGLAQVARAAERIIVVVSMLYMRRNNGIVCRLSSHPAVLLYAVMAGIIRGFRRNVR